MAADAEPDADDTSFATLELESIGGLKIRDAEATVIAKLGKPTSKSKPQLEGATGEYASDWTWPNTTINMVAETEGGAATARLISIRKTSTLETAKHLHIGSTRAEVEKAYERSPDDDGSKPESYLVGSMYGGMLFSFKANRVTEIALGPFAF